MRRQRGFTLLEMMVTVAIVAIVAGLAFVGLRAARRNASVGSASFELVLKLEGLRTKALAEQRDHLAVLVAGDGGACGLLRSEGCVRLFVLAAPAAAWALEDFSPADAGASLEAAPRGEVVDRIVLPTGLALHGAAAGIAGRPPFANVEAWDADLDATCGAVRCVAFRFQANGEVRGETPDGTVVRKPGHIVALATDLEGESGAAERRAVLVSFPSGIVKSYTY